MANLISIHAFRVEDDAWQIISAITALVFQSTPSVWKTTSHFRAKRQPKKISIHAFRVEDDDITHPCQANNISISIHAFRVEDDVTSLGLPAFIASISIHAFRVEDDLSIRALGGSAVISIHAFRVEDDALPPRNRRSVSDISIHAFRVEDDGCIKDSSSISVYFNPRLPCGRRRSRFFVLALYARRFQSTPSVWKTTRWRYAVDYSSN